MVSKSKLYHQLDSLESELEETLVPLLTLAAEGKNDFLFCVNDFNRFSELSSKTDNNMQACVTMGAQILTLKNKLGEPSQGSIAERICWYCREWGNSDPHHHNTTQELAADFLSEIQQNKINQQI